MNQRDHCQANFTITEAIETWKNNYKEYQNHKKNEKPLDFNSSEKDYYNMQFDFPKTKEEATKLWNNAMSAEEKDKFVQQHKVFIYKLTTFIKSNTKIFNNIPKVLTNHLQLKPFEEKIPSGSFKHGKNKYIYMNYPGFKQNVIQSFKSKEFQNTFRDFFYDIIIKYSDFIVEKIQETYESNNVPDAWGFKYYYRVKLIN